MVDEWCLLRVCVSNAPAVVIHLLCATQEACGHRMSSVVLQHRVTADPDTGGSGHNLRVELMWLHGGLQERSA